MTEALPAEVERNTQTINCKTSSLHVGEIPWKFNEYSNKKKQKNAIHRKSISCRYTEPRTWNRNDTEMSQSQLKHYHCSSERFLYTSRNWNQKPQLMTQSTVKQSDAGILTQTMLSDVQRNARTFSCKMLRLFVKEIPTDVKKTGNKSHLKDTIHSKSIWCRDIDWSATNWSGTKCTDSQLRKIIIVCQTDSYGHHKTGNKNHQRHDPQKIQFDAATLNHAI